jgi:drug/metabolite transporter (DMT)-like permease
MLRTTMVAALLALAGALVYGSADFLGGLAARRLRSVVVTATAATSGLGLLLIALPFLGGRWLIVDVLWGALSGVTGAVAIGLLYACLAIGPMSILSPLTAVVSAVAPMLWGLLIEQEELAPFGYAGLLLALVAVVLVAFLPGERITRPSLRGILMATGSGLAIGAFLIMIDRTSTESGIVPLIVNRAVGASITGLVVLLVIVAALRRGDTPRSALTATGVHVGATPSGHADLEHATSPIPLARQSLRRTWTLAILCGAVDATANVLLLLALRVNGDLAIVSALTALYPAGTVLLAAVVLREHIARVQWLGLVLALVAGALLALA